MKEQKKPKKTKENQKKPLGLQKKNKQKILQTDNNQLCQQLQTVSKKNLLKSLEKAKKLEQKKQNSPILSPYLGDKTKIDYIELPEDLVEQVCIFLEKDISLDKKIIAISTILFDARMRDKNSLARELKKISDLIIGDSKDSLTKQDVVNMLVNIMNKLKEK